MWERACSQRRPDSRPLSNCHPAIQKCGSGLAREGGPTADRYLTVTPRSNCGSGLACEGGLTADLDVGSDRVHIRYLGNGCYGFRPYGGSLLEKSPKSNQKGSCPNTRHLAHARCARNPTGIWGAAATRPPWRGAAKPASLPVYPPNPCRIPASVFDGAPEIKSTIKIKIKIKSGSLRIVVGVGGCKDFRLVQVIQPQCLRHTLANQGCCSRGKPAGR
ncbi:hypothetical protein ACVWXR_000870 [Pseudomonas lurida]